MLSTGSSLQIRTIDDPRASASLVLDPSRHVLLASPQGGAKLGPGADPLALPEEDKGDGAHEQADAAEEGARGGYAEAGEHGDGGEGEDGGQQRAGGGGRGVGGGGEYFVGVC